MENKVCVKCGEESNNKLPLCDFCREELKDFGALVEYLNSFGGSKEDLLWIIGSELSSRECSIISQVRVENDFANGKILMVPIEPSSSTLKVKPWLWDKFEHIRQTIEEISKLRRALGIAKQYYGVT
jgi:hypothetical protein